MKRTTLAVFAALLSAACGSYSTSPYSVSGGGGGGVGGGPVGHVTVGNNFFQSTHNGTQNAAVDTIAAGTSVTWSWAASGSHSIQSTGTQPEVFRNSVVMSANGSSYAVTFNTPGTYTYDCAIHGAAMSGRIVVQ
jgi:plastocyanin